LEKRLLRELIMALSIHKIEFDGFEAVEILTSKARLVAITSMGPRIAHFGTRHGRNLLYWDYVRKYSRGAWKLMGGHRIWTTRPLADESEESYGEDNDACSVKISPRGVDIQGAVNSVFKLRKSISIRVLDDQTLQIENKVTNESHMLWSGGVWSLTCTLPKATTTYGIPLGGKGEWDIFSLVIPRRWAGTQSTKVNDPALTFTEDCLILRPKGKISKRMIQAPQGIIGMTDPSQEISFIKHSPYQMAGKYPWNCNIAYYVGKQNFMVELENMGPQQSVVPGGTLSTKETWMLRKPVNWTKLKGNFIAD
jgi:hypothetical protein